MIKIQVIFALLQFSIVACSLLGTLKGLQKKEGMDDRKKYFLDMFFHSNKTVTERSNVSTSSSKKVFLPPKEINFLDYDEESSTPTTTPKIIRITTEEPVYFDDVRVIMPYDKDEIKILAELGSVRDQEITTKSSEQDTTQVNVTQLPTTITNTTTTTFSPVMRPTMSSKTPQNNTSIQKSNELDAINKLNETNQLDKINNIDKINKLQKINKVNKLHEIFENFLQDMINKKLSSNSTKVTSQTMKSVKLEENNKRTEIKESKNLRMNYRVNKAQKIVSNQFNLTETSYTNSKNGIGKTTLFEWPKSTPKNPYIFGFNKTPKRLSEIDVFESIDDEQMEEPYSNSFGRYMGNLGTALSSETTTQAQIKPSQCYYCGLEEEDIPTSRSCARAFYGKFNEEFSDKLNMKAYCIPSGNNNTKVVSILRKSDFDENGYTTFEGNFYENSCFHRFTDVGELYLERGCRSYGIVQGKSLASKHYSRLEAKLSNQVNGCVSSSYTAYLPFTRNFLGLYVRFNSCVCTGHLCNYALSLHQSCSLYFFILIFQIKRYVCTL